MDDYFKRKDLISNSQLGWFKRSPMYYRMKMTTDDEKKDSVSLERGSLLHLAALEPEKFVVADVEPIGGMMGTFIQEVAKSTLPDAGGYIHANAYTKAGFKISQDRVIKDLDKPENQVYLNFLLEANGKIVLTKEDARIVDKCLNALKKHKAAHKLMFSTDLFSDTEIEVHNELEIFWNKQLWMENSKVKVIKCRSKIDRLVINHETKTIKIVDLKTTSKTARGSITEVASTGDITKDYLTTGFLSSFIHYNYYRQMAFYEDAVMWWLLGQARDYSGYSIEVYMVVVETIGVNEVEVYNVSQELLAAGRDESEFLLEALQYHEETGDWDYREEYYKGDGIVVL